MTDREIRLMFADDPDDPGEENEPDGDSPGADDSTNDSGAPGGGADDGDNEPAFESLEDANAKYKELMGQLSEATEKNKTLSSKLGKQGEQVGTLKRLQSLMEQNPQGMIEEIAKQAKLNVRFGESNDDIDLEDILESQDGERLQALIDKRAEQKVSAMQKELAPQFERLFSESMKQKYPDFEDLADDRQTLASKVLSKEITQQELLHLAAQGARMPEVLAAAEKRGREKYIKELKDKTHANYPDGGGPTQPKEHDPADRDYLMKVLSDMRNIT